MDVVADNAKWCSQTARLSHLLQGTSFIVFKKKSSRVCVAVVAMLRNVQLLPCSRGLAVYTAAAAAVAKASCNQMDHNQHIAYDYKLLCCTAGMFSSASVSDSQACSVAKLAVMRATGQSVKAKLSITYVTCMQVSLVAGHAQSFLFPKGVTKAMFDLQIVYLIDNSWFLTTA